MNNRYGLFAKGLFILLFAAMVGAVYGNGNRDERRYGYGPGMMGGGYGYGPGTTSGGSGYGPGMMAGGYGLAQLQDSQATSPAEQGLKRLSLDDAKKDVQNYLDSIGNKNLVVDEVMEFDLNFYALIKEKDSGKGAFELIVDPYRGFVSPEPGPNMMWNAKYGPMSWRNEADGAMPVDIAKARESAQKYVDGIGSGYSVEEKPDEFYGYYTAHVLKGDKIVGMLSVNGYTGQVWFHSWHGTYIAME